MMREATKASGTLGVMIEVRAFRDGSAIEEHLALGDAERLIADDGNFVWIDVTDPQPDEIDALGAIFALHPLTIEDAHHRHQRPKVELFEGYAFVVAHPLAIRDAPGGEELVDQELVDQELHAFVGRRYIATIRYGADPFSMKVVEHRWLGQADILASEGGGFATYVLLDEVVDGYLSIIESFEDRADDLEDDVFGATAGDDQGTALQERIFRLKREVVRLRRFAAPLRQSLDLIQEEPRLAGSKLQPYYRDVSEHVIRVTELADNIRDLLTSLLEVRVSQVANRLNEITKKISAWAGIILVPTLIAGIYGMNFEHMPELGWRFGYPGAIGAMVLSGIALYAVFKRRGWL
jgi:magnesium transporter